MSADDFDTRSLAPARTARIAFDDGSFVLRSPEPLKPYARCTGEWLEHWAAATPDAVAFAERGRDGRWRRLTWRETREQAGRIAQGLLGLKLRPGAPVVVLSDNSIDHLLLILACGHVGRAVCSISSAYSRLAKDSSRIRGILDTLGHALVYADDAQVYGQAIAGANLPAIAVFSKGASTFPGALSFEHLGQTVEGPAVMQAFAQITPDTHAKYLLTSGSTGQPKVVINTHRMLCANQQMLAQAWRFLEHEKPVLCDWLPWSHTFGGNHNPHLVMRNGGTLFIDQGRPTAEAIETTLANLRDVRPTIHFNVPRGLDMLLPLLEADEAAARAFFDRLRVVFYAGAALPQSTWDRLQALARKLRGREIWLTTGWGATETAPAVTSPHWPLERAGNIGLPLPGVELKFVPNGGKLEMRVRGVTVFPGYRDSPQLTAQAFDEEGYYRIGDAGRLADPQRPEAGVIFDGRVAEDFKLTTGTWVCVNALRVRAICALAPHVQDAVVTGHDRDEIGLLLFPSQQGSRLDQQTLREHVRQAFAALRSEGGGSSQLPRRALVLAEPPSVEAGEITDKGYLNQGAILRRRAELVARLYDGGDDVITA